MKNILLFYGFFIGSLLAISCTNSVDRPSKTDVTKSSHVGPSGVYNVDVNESVINWKGTMLGIKVHEGTIHLKEGRLIVDQGVLTGGTFVADMTTLTATDENYNPEAGLSREELLGHLASADFFDIKNHPTAMFVISGGSANTANGELTVRGHSNLEKVQNLIISGGKEKVMATGHLNFNRKNYGIAWDSPIKKNVLSNTIELTIEISGFK